MNLSTRDRFCLIQVIIAAMGNSLLVGRGGIEDVLLTQDVYKRLRKTDIDALLISGVKNGVVNVDVLPGDDGAEYDLDAVKHFMHDCFLMARGLPSLPGFDPERAVKLARMLDVPLPIEEVA